MWTRTLHSTMPCHRPALVSASGLDVYDDKPSFQDQTSQTRQEILDWAVGRGQLMLVALAALVAIAIILAFAGV